MTKAAYDSYVAECKNRGIKPSTKKDLERWEDIEIESPAERGTPFSQLSDDARLTVTKRTLKKIYEKTYLEGFNDGKAEASDE